MFIPGRKKRRKKYLDSSAGEGAPFRLDASTTYPIYKKHVDPEATRDEWRRAVAGLKTRKG